MFDTLLDLIQVGIVETEQPTPYTIDWYVRGDDAKPFHALTYKLVNPS